MNKIEKRIEELRDQLNRLMIDIDSYYEGKVLEVSQELDKIIYEYIEVKKIKSN